jgi:uncharacterized membrane protein HdeD (DUF308 family)
MRVVHCGWYDAARWRGAMARQGRLARRLNNCQSDSTHEKRRIAMSWLFLVILGILSIVAGIYALFNAVAASVVATLIAGWMFVFFGVVQIAAAFQASGWGARILSVLLGVVVLAVGLNIIGKPLEGMLTLTFVIGVLFVASGIVKLFLGFSVSGNLRWTILLSAVASLILGAMVLTNFPRSAEILLGILLAVELISNGIWLMAIGWVEREAKKVVTAAVNPDAV